jgi:hypothetical protein
MAVKVWAGNKRSCPGFTTQWTEMTLGSAQGTALSIGWQNFGFNSELVGTQAFVFDNRRGLVQVANPSGFAVEWTPWMVYTTDTAEEGGDVEGSIEEGEAPLAAPGES